MAVMGNAANASKIPNQANITSTINAKISMADTIIDVIIKASAKNKLSNANMTKNMVNYRNTVNTILGKDGIIEAYLTGSDNMIKLNKTKSSDQKAAMSMIINFQKEIEVLIKGLSKLKITDNQIKKIVSNLKPINTLSEAIAKNGINKTLVTKAISSFEPFNDLLTAISNIFTSLDNLKVPRLLGFKFRRIRRNLRRLTFLAAYITLLNGFTPVFLGAMLALKQFAIITNLLTTVFDNINNTKLTLKTIIKIKLLPSVIRNLINIVLSINRIAKIISVVNGLADISILTTVFLIVNKLFDIIQDTSLMFINRKIKRIAKALRLLHKVLRQIRRIRVRASSIMKLLVIKMMMTTLALMFISIILLTPIAILVIPALLILWGAMLIIRFLVNAIIKIIVKMALKAIVGFLAILIIVSLLTAIAVMLFIVALVSQKVVKSALWILGLIGVVMIIALFAAGVGLLLAAVGPFTLIIVAGFELIAVVIGLILIIGVMLLMLQVLNIDPDAVRESVECVIGTAMYIVTAIFGAKDVESEKSDKGWLDCIIKYVGGTLITVLSALMAVAFLATMVAAILMVLVIAATLRLLQELELNPDKIKENVNIVLATAKMIIEIIFGTEDTKAEDSEKSWFKSLAEFIGGTIVTVITAILAMKYLTTMVTAILAVLLIAAELRLLQILDLDPVKIKENVDIVIGTAKHVIDAIFGSEDKDADASEKDWIVSVIEFVGGAIATVAGAIMAVSFLAITIVSVLFIIIIAAELKKIEDIGLSDNIKDKVNNIVGSAKAVVDAVMNKDGNKGVKATEEDKGWFRSALDFIGGAFKSLLGAFTAMVWFGQAMIITSLVHTLAEHLSYISNVKLATNITAKVNKITRAADDVIRAMLGKKSTVDFKLAKEDDDKAELIEDLYPNIDDDGAEAISRMPFVANAMIQIAMVKNLSSALDLLKYLPDHSGVVKKASNIRKTVDDVIKEIQLSPIKIEKGDKGVSDRLGYLERINASIKTITDISDAKLKRTRRAVEGHINLLKEINKVDAGKLTTTANMFEQMARFSESVSGNFDKLADTLNEKILPDVKKLKAAVDNLPENFEKALAKVQIAMKSETYQKNIADDFLGDVAGSDWDSTSLDKIKKEITASRADKVEAPEILMQIVGILMQLSNGTAFKTTTV